jgi:hypothetical protein
MKEVVDHLLLPGILGREGRRLGGKRNVVALAARMSLGAKGAAMAGTRRDRQRECDDADPSQAVSTIDDLARNSELRPVASERISATRINATSVQRQRFDANNEYLLSSLI